VLRRFILVAMVTGGAQHSLVEIVLVAMLPTELAPPRYLGVATVAAVGARIGEDDRIAVGVRVGAPPPLILRVRRHRRPPPTADAVWFSWCGCLVGIVRPVSGDAAASEAAASEAPLPRSLVLVDAVAVYRQTVASEAAASEARAGGVRGAEEATRGRVVVMVVVCQWAGVVHAEECREKEVHDSSRASWGLWGRGVGGNWVAVRRDAQEGASDVRIC